MLHTLVRGPQGGKVSLAGSQARSWDNIIIHVYPNSAPEVWFEAHVTGYLLLPLLSTFAPPHIWWFEVAEGRELTSGATSRTKLDLLLA